MDLLVGGWQVAGINTLAPGEMVTLTYSPAAAFQVSGITNDFSGANNYRPNITCDPYASEGQQSITNWFNTALCRFRPIRASRSATRRATTSAGRTSRSSISPRARLAAGGRIKVQFRLEAFNLFNRVNFLAPASNRSASTFGTITNTYDPRQVQLGVKLLW